MKPLIFFTIFVALLFVSFPHAISAQASGSLAPKRKRNEPGVYITFERIGPREPLREGESNRGVWLRLHNNMRTSIRFCAFGISGGTKLAFYNRNSVLGVNYEVELTDPTVFHSLFSDSPLSTLPDVPTGYLVGGMCHYYHLKTGQSAAFAVPAEHLQGGLSIKIQFKFGWEQEGDDEPYHYVYFNSASIPEPYQVQDNKAIQ